MPNFQDSIFLGLSRIVKCQGLPKTVSLDSGATELLKLEQEKYKAPFRNPICRVQTLDVAKPKKTRAAKSSRLASPIIENIEYGIDILTFYEI